MSIIMKFIIKNIIEKKLRTVLIVFSVMLSSALFFASMAISDTIIKMYVDKVNQKIGDVNIIVQPDENSPSLFFNMKKSYSDNFIEFISGAILAKAAYKTSAGETIGVNIQGIDIQDLKQIRNIYLKDGKNLSPFEGKKIIIGERNAQKYGLEIGSVLKLKVGEEYFDYRVCAICNAKGFFEDDGTIFSVIMPYSEISSVYNLKDKYNIIYVKTRSTENIKSVLNSLKNDYPGYIVKEPIDSQDLERQTKNIATPFLLMTIIISVMSVFIIYSSFKVLTLERIPIIGTFRSIGATKRETSLIMLVESLIYGIIGGILGVILGIGLLYLLASKISLNTAYISAITNQDTYIVFNHIHIILAIGLAMFVTTISSIVPIFKTSKISLKDIILNNIENSKIDNKYKTLLGIFLLGFALIIPHTKINSFSMLLGILALIFSVIGITLLIPKIIEITVVFLINVFKFLDVNEPVLALRNLLKNKNVSNSISLLVIGIAALFMINNVTYSALTELSTFFTQKATFNIFVSDSYADKTLERKVLSVKGVDSLLSVYETLGIEVTNKKIRLEALQGVDINKYFSYWNVNTDNQQIIKQKLSTGKYIVIGSAMKDKYSIKTGDKLTLKTRKGERQYTVLGFVNTLLYLGSYGIISEENYKEDVSSNYFNYLYIKTTENTDDVLKNLSKIFISRQASLITIKDMEKNNIDSNKQMFSALQGFSILALTIGILGIVNNMTISLIERRRFIAIYRSIGMSIKQLVKMIFIETLVCGLIGGFLGVMAGFLLTLITPYIISIMGIPVEIRVSISLVMISFVSGTIIMLLASITPMLKSTKLNLMESLKYE